MPFFKLIRSVALLVVCGSLFSACGLHSGLPDIWIDSAEISPDGKNVLISYKYKDLFHKVALLDIEQSPPTFSPVFLPPKQDWRFPTFSNDMKHFAVASYCGEQTPYECHEGAFGWTIWKGGVDGSFTRMTPYDNKRTRIFPVFGKNTNELYYISAQNPDPERTYIWLYSYTTRPMGKDRPEQTLFPSESGYSILNMKISKDIDEKDYLFLGEGTPKEYFQNRFGDELDYDETYLFRKTHEDFALEYKFPVKCFATSNTSKSYIFARLFRNFGWSYPKHSSKVYILREGEPEPKLLFDFEPGFIVELSFDDEMKRLVFLVHDYKNNEHNVWLYNFESGTYHCLNAKQLIENGILLYIKEERKECPETREKQ